MNRGVYLGVKDEAGKNYTTMYYRTHGRDQKCIEIITKLDTILQT
jgi:hypothetical protein